MTNTREAPEKLSRREREIMEILFASDDPLSAEDVRAQLSEPPGYSAVRAMLAKLETKGHVRHHEAGLRYLYVPTTSRQAARRTALSRLVRVFFDGSPRHTAAALLKAERWTDEELDALTAEIDRVREQRRFR
jgi:predicted transcriptional regulator